MTKKARMPASPDRATRREFTEEFRREAVQMMLDGHTASSVAERLGLSGTNLLYRWKREQQRRTGPVATSPGSARVREVELQLSTVSNASAVAFLKKKRWLFSAGPSDRGLRRR